jgi:hypothetical protein
MSTPLSENNLLKQTIEQQNFSSTLSTICSQHIFAFECQDTNCCESYHQRFLMLLFSILIFIIAIIIFILMIISFKWRPFLNWTRRFFFLNLISELFFKNKIILF